MKQRAFRLGLTGSIGMGKSTTARFFEQAGIPVWDADAAVHHLYDTASPAGEAISRIWPDVVDTRGRIDRNALREVVQRDDQALGRIEAIVHPLVQADRDGFLSNATADIVVLDIPLLFETGADRIVDSTLLVTAPVELQRARVLARAGMTEERFKTMIDRQMADCKKRARATHIIETLSLASAQACVVALIAYIRSCRDA